MIILVQPMYSKQQLNADSNYVVYTQLIKGMLKVRPDWHFYVIFPDDKSGYKYEPDGFFRLPNVTRIPQRISPRKFSNAASFDGMWWDKLMRKLAFDVVWVNLIEIAGHIKYAGQSSYDKIGRPLIVGAHNYVVHKSLPYPYESMENIAVAQIMGAYHCDAHVFNSDHCHWMFFDNAARYLNEKTIQKLEKTATKINYGTLEDSLELVTNNNKVPIIGYNHRLQGYKNHNKTFELLNEIYSRGVKFKVHFINNTIENAAKILSYPFVEMKLCATREEYITALRKCDMNVTNSQHETFCIAAIESMACGQPLVAPMGVTFPEITGRKHNGYPFLFTNPAEQDAMVTKLLTEPKTRQKWGKIVSEHVRSSYNNRLWAENYAELFEKMNVHEIHSEADAKDFVLDSIKRNNGATLDQLKTVIWQSVVNGRIPFSSQSMPMVKLARLVRHLGARVVVEDGQEKVRL